jgi:hypothetical protein
MSALLPVAGLPNLYGPAALRLCGTAPEPTPAPAVLAHPEEAPPWVFRSRPATLLVHHG